MRKKLNRSASSKGRSAQTKKNRAAYERKQNRKHDTHDKRQRDYRAALKKLGRKTLPKGTHVTHSGSHGNGKATLGDAKKNMQEGGRRGGKNSSGGGRPKGSGRNSRRKSR